jgi:hypothetical protein
MKLPGQRNAGENTLLIWYSSRVLQHFGSQLSSTGVQVQALAPLTTQALV